MALQSIQHRGQDAAGVGTMHEGRIRVVKAMGLISQALPAEKINSLPGRTGIAHVRYPTAGTQAAQEDAQPFQTRRPGILLAHNGNITNVNELDLHLQNHGLHMMSQCDAEPILLVLAHELTNIRPAHHTVDDVVQAVGAVIQRLRGGYSVVATLQVENQETLIAFRDPQGIRPGVYGQRADGSWMVASESVALDVLGFKKIGDLPCDSLVLMRANEPAKILPIPNNDTSNDAGTKQPRHCIFERIYFARPDSTMEDGRVNRTRWRMGRQLAQEWAQKGHSADVVVAVPDTSRPAAMAMADELGIANREGFIKNRYSGRTFIMPDPATRDTALRLKLNPIREIFEGKRVLLVDDSIVRGSTMKRIVEMLRSLSPQEVHVAIFSPPVRYPCFFGIDMPSRSELVAGNLEPHTIESELCRMVGADSLTFLSLEGLSKVNGPHICSACFDGDYPVHVSAEERAQITRQRRPT